VHLIRTVITVNFLLVIQEEEHTYTLGRKRERS
jgi:hypothetical protein